MRRMTSGSSGSLFALSAESSTDPCRDSFGKKSVSFDAALASFLAAAESGKGATAGDIQCESAVSYCAGVWSWLLTVVDTASNRADKQTAEYPARALAGSLGSAESGEEFKSMRARGVNGQPIE